MSYLSEVLADNPLHYWRCADPGGSLGHDIGSSPKQMHSNPQDLFGYSGPISNGGSVDLSLGGWYANTGDPITHPGGAMSLECIVWPYQGMGNVGQFIYLANGGNQFSLAKTGAAWQAVYNAVGAGVVATNYVAQAWRHLVMTYGAGVVTLYVDAIAGAPAAAAASGAFSSIVELGQSLGGASFGNAFIAEAAIYTTTLTPARVTAHFVAIDNGIQSPIWSAAGGLSGGGGGGTSYNGILQQILQSVRKIY